MRAVIQRVKAASVTVEGELISSIGAGLCVLVGIHRKDTEKDAEYIARKIINTRLFDSDEGKRWNMSVKDLNYEILLLSQFTLNCVLKGNKPDFHASMAPEEALPFYEKLVERVKQLYVSDMVKTGKFGHYSQIHIENDGPVTIELDSHKNTE